MSRVSLQEVYRRLFEAFGPQRWWPAGTKLEMILGAILTQNTAWSNVEKSIQSLKKKRLLSIRSLNHVSSASLALAVRSSGFFNMKSRRIKGFLKHLKSLHRNRLGHLLGQDKDLLRKELLGIDGIGPETADSIILYAAQKAVFVVDAYTRRIFKRLGVLKGDEDYEEIRHLFETRLPKNTKLFNEFHALIVRLAKERCRKRPVCEACPLDMICPKLIT